MRALTTNKRNKILLKSLQKGSNFIFKDHILRLIVVLLLYCYLNSRLKLICGTIPGLLLVCCRQACGVGAGIGVVRSRSFFGWSWSRIPNNTGSRSRIFCPTPTPDVQLDHFLHHILKLRIPVEMVRFLLKLLLKEISCCASRFPLILTAKFHSLYVKESETEILERPESRVGYSSSDSAALVAECVLNDLSRLKVV